MWPYLMGDSAVVEEIPFQRLNKLKGLGVYIIQWNALWVLMLITMITDIPR